MSKQRPKQAAPAAPRALHADLFPVARPPVLAAWGVGVDSTAMLVEMVEAGEPVDHVLFADTGSEKPETYAYFDLFSAWLRARGVPVTVVRYQPKNFKNFPAYGALDENCFTNGTLPSIAFGFGSCSQKWKIAPQNAWAKTWAPAVEAWASGVQVVKLIGYDASPADSRRSATAAGYTDPGYLYRYPLREWGWTREMCEERIRRAGLPVPLKSACYMCTATKPAELEAMPPGFLRRIVVMEARAKPRLRAGGTEGLWRSTVKGCRGAAPKPGAMSTYIRSQGLLPASEIDLLESEAPQDLQSWQEAQARVPAESRPNIGVWFHDFGRRHGMSFDAPGARALFPALAQAA